MKAILTDTTKCIGCRECVIACKKEYNLKDEVPRRWNVDDGLSARNWTSIVEHEGKYIRKQCRHCVEPACVSACPVAALTKSDMGAVVYDSKKCLGCRYCMMACPYGIPRYDWDRQIPYVRKCILCADRVKDGRQPACTEACPTEATIFGERDELIAIAHQRSNDNRDLYKNMVWGEHEVGGTSVLYISDVDLSFLTYGRPLGDTPLPDRTASAMRAVPYAFVGMASLMTGLSWIIGRRNKLKAEQEKSGTEAESESIQDGENNG